jgi:uncharacterized protein
MLKVDLAELIREPGRHIEHRFDDLPQSDDDIEYMSSAVGRVTISNSGNLVVVRGRFVTSIRMECGRCLCEVTEPITADIDEQYTLTDVSLAGSHDTGLEIVGDEENELPIGLMDGNVMDLGILIRQSTMLAMPLSTLCKADCKGMCATCGKNRNLEANGCQCGHHARNTPLSVLKQLYNLDGSEAESNKADAGN